MKIEDQVISLELAKRLKELKVKQESFWAWYETTDRDDIPRLNRFDENCPACTLKKQNFEEKYSAFTTSELGEMLKKYPESVFVKLPEEFKPTEKDVRKKIFDANFWAKMLIYLKENNLT